jgi:hypothetical protein
MGSWYEPCACMVDYGVVCVEVTAAPRYCICKESTCIGEAAAPDCPAAAVSGRLSLGLDTSASMGWRSTSVTRTDGVTTLGVFASAAVGRVMGLFYNSSASSFSDIANSATSHSQDKQARGLGEGGGGVPESGIASIPGVAKPCRFCVTLRRLTERSLRSSPSSVCDSLNDMFRTGGRNRQCLASTYPRGHIMPRLAMVISDTILDMLQTTNYIGIARLARCCVHTRGGRGGQSAPVLRLQPHIHAGGVGHSRYLRGVRKELAHDAPDRLLHRHLYPRDAYLVIRRWTRGKSRRPMQQTMEPLLSKHAYRDPKTNL